MTDLAGCIQTKKEYSLKAILFLFIDIILYQISSII